MIEEPWRRDVDEVRRSVAQIQRRSNSGVKAQGGEQSPTVGGYKFRAVASNAA